MGRIILRECGIYALPDKREFVVRGCGRDGYTFFFTPGLEGIILF